MIKNKSKTNHKNVAKNYLSRLKMKAQMYKLKRLAVMITQREAKLKLKEIVVTLRNMVAQCKYLTISIHLRKS
jgi:hypothetical protein